MGRMGSIRIGGEISVRGAGADGPILCACEGAASKHTTAERRARRNHLRRKPLDSPRMPATSPHKAPLRAPQTSRSPKLPPLARRLQRVGRIHSTCCEALSNRLARSTASFLDPAPFYRLPVNGTWHEQHGARADRPAALAPAPLGASPAPAAISAPSSRTSSAPSRSPASRLPACSSASAPSSSPAASSTACPWPCSR